MWQRYKKEDSKVLILFLIEREYYTITILSDIKMSDGFDINRYKNNFVYYKQNNEIISLIYFKKDSYYPILSKNKEELKDSLLKKIFLIKDPFLVMGLSEDCNAFLNYFKFSFQKKIENYSMIREIDNSIIDDEFYKKEKEFNKENIYFKN